MPEFKADLHIHTVLSPCGDMEMSPVNIINAAVEKGLDIIGITDHNTTRHCELISELGKEKGIFVLMGAEVNTREEIHCLTFFETLDQLAEFQSFFDLWLPDIKNDPGSFGYQVQVNRQEEIIYEEDRSLFGAINRSVDEVEEKVHEMEGIFIPAHIDRSRNSVYSQLGFFPEDLPVDAVEISRASDPSVFITLHPEISGFTVIRSSDAHFPWDIGRVLSFFDLRNMSFPEVKLALMHKAGRGVRS